MRRTELLVSAAGRAYSAIHHFSTGLLGYGVPVCSTTIHASCCKRGSIFAARRSFSRRLLHWGSSRAGGGEGRDAMAL
jgi:hypothetical protein